MRSQIRSVVGAAAGLALACAARGQVVYSTYTAGDAYSQGFTQVTFAGFGKNAVRFVPASSGAIDQVEISLGRISSAAAAMLMIVPEVTPVSGPPQGAPGTLPVWCSTAGPAAVDVRSIHTFTGPRGSVVGGQAYWLVIEATDSVGWFNNSGGLVGTTATKNATTFWSIVPTTLLPAFRVSAANPMTPTGACCNVTTGGCTMMESAPCITLGLQYNGNGATCGVGACSACPADFNHSGGLSVEDIFAFLNAWFAGCQ